MTTFNDLSEAFLASRDFENSTIGRISFWCDQFGDKSLTDITDDDVDDALVALAQRGRLRSGRGIETEKTGKPLSPATINRYISQLGSLFCQTACNID